ncbi:hypothetical protein WAK64_16755 [Bacillus spongiae]|uniref:DUF5050 domain-containing protein n=2 Tax=Bacillus spongiae TaxID=2683610 RepID=A0ABU8HH59_9BACI
MRKLKTFGIPIVLCSCLFLVLYFQQLNEINQLPNDEWSRSLPLDVSLSESKQVFHNDNKMYLTSSSGVQVVELNQQMTTQSDTLPLKVDKGKGFWTNGEKFVYLNKKRVILSDLSSETVIAENITDVKGADEQVVYWADNALYRLYPDTGETTLLSTFENNLENVYFLNSGEIVVSTPNEWKTKANLYLLNSQDDLPILLSSVDTGYQFSINGISGNIEANGKILLLIEKNGRKQGNITYQSFIMEGTIEDFINNTVPLEKIKFYDKDSQHQFYSFHSLSNFLMKDKTTFTFLAEGIGVFKKNDFSLYLGELKGNKVESRLISTTDHVANDPFYANNFSSIYWLIYKGESHKLYFSSNDEAVIKDSLTLSKEDYFNAFYNSFLMLFSGFIVLLTSFYVYLPSLAFLIYLNIFKPNIMESEGVHLVEYVSIGMFLVMPIFYLATAMDSFFYSIAPSYLTFDGSLWVISFVLSLLTTLVWKWGRDPEWTAMLGSFYFMFVYMLLLIFSVGPYFFDLF